ncbi:MAG: D-glycero-beta-D-manno-heptose 1-phosphate adenylyltransferase [Aquificaceae bacterium]
MVLGLEKVLDKIASVRPNKKIVFTNGCFDIFHAGHADYLNVAKTFGDILIVGINSDNSVKRLKGEKRPVIPLEMRAYVLSSHRAVDFVIPFEEDTPIKLIEAIRPDVLVKGKDWEGKEIVGKEFVLSYGGKVELISFRFSISTSLIISRIKELYSSVDS